MLPGFVAFFHHIMAFTFAAALVLEFVLIRDAIDERNAKRLILADAIYAGSATFVLIIGFIRVYYFEKGADYYWHSTPFIAKLSLFVLIALLSFYTSLEFLKWKKSLKTDVPPAPEATCPKVNSSVASSTSVDCSCPR